MKYNYKQIKKSFKDGGSITSRLVMNHVSVPFIYVISNYTKITPNNITIIGFLLGLYSMYLFLDNSFIFGIIFFELSYIFDCIDGRLARLTNNTSKIGDMLDHILGQFLVLILSIPFFLYFYYLNMYKEILLLVLFIFLSPFNYFINYYCKYTFATDKESLIQSDGSNNFFKKLHLYLKNKGMKSIPSDTEAIHIMFVVVPLLIFLNLHNSILFVIILADIIFLVDIFITIYRNVKLNSKL